MLWHASSHLFTDPSTDSLIIVCVSKAETAAAAAAGATAAVATLAGSTVAASATKAIQIDVRIRLNTLMGVGEGTYGTYAYVPDVGLRMVSD